MDRRDLMKTIGGIGIAGAFGTGTAAAGEHSEDAGGRGHGPSGERRYNVAPGWPEAMPDSQFDIPGYPEALK